MAVTVHNMENNEFCEAAEFEFLGDSSDDKPTGDWEGFPIGVNSTFLELDTGNVYYYDGSSWNLFGGE